MSLLDSVAGMLGGSGGAGGAAGAVLEMLQNHPGGAAGLAEQFHAGGLGHLVQSWAGPGENLNVSADQIQSVLGEEHIAAVAGKLGINPQEASATIAQYLPQVMSAISQNGQMPGVGTDLSSLAGGLLKSFLSKGA
ncbi:MAG TPA: YidB family protein [Bryobacteraceae bacterium]|nr:YidB family protein [Bryobacteraceae bacterium]